MQDGTIPLSGLSLLVVCRQWGMYVKRTTAVEKIVLPVTSTFLRGSVTDGGNGNNSYGLDPSLNVYGPSGGVSYICLCKAQANRQWGKCNSDTIQGYPISFNEEPIVLGIHYGGQADVNIVSSGSLGDAALANCFFYHSNYNGKVQVNWIAIGLQTYGYPVCIHAFSTITPDIERKAP